MILTGTESLIMKALQDHLGKVVLFPSLPVSYIGVNFTPPDSGMWLEANIFPGPIVEMGMENTPQIIHRGVFQVGVADETGKGSLQATEIASAISNHFKKGTELSIYGTITKIINRPEVSGPIQDDNKTIIPVSIRYQCSK